MFTFPNAPYTGEHHLNLEVTPELQEQIKAFPENLQQLLVGFKMMLSNSMAALAKERKGLKNELAIKPDERFTAIVMRADDLTNPPETQDSE